MSVCKGGFSNDATRTPRTSPQRLVADLPESFYTRAAKEISLSEAPNFAEAIINNQIRGRTLVKVN